MTLLRQGANTAVDPRDPLPMQGAAPAGAYPADAGDLVTYGRNAKRALRGAAVGAVLGLAAAAAALLLVAPSHTAESTVRINPLTTAPFDGTRSASGLIDPATEAAVAQSDAVFDLAISRYGPLGVDADELRSAVEVTPVDASTVLQVAVTAGDPADAQQQADAIAEAYLEHRAATALNRQDDLVDNLLANLTAVDGERQAIGDRFKAAPPGSVARQQALVEHRAVVAQRDSLSAQLEALEELDTAGGEVLNSAESMPTAVSPDRRLTVASGATGGAVLGFLVAFLLGQLGNRVRHKHDLEKVAGLAFSAEVHDSRKARGRSNLETFRAMREQRKLDGWPEPPYSTVLALDLRRSSDLGVPLSVAQALAQEHGSATVLALGWQPEHESRLDSLGLQQLGSGYVTASEPRVALQTFERDDAADVADEFLTPSAIKALESLSTQARPIVVWCPGSCGESTRLALLSRSDTLLVVLEPRHSRISDLRRSLAEAAGASVAWVGALIVR